MQLSNMNKTFVLTLYLTHNAWTCPVRGTRERPEEAYDAFNAFEDEVGVDDPYLGSPGEGLAGRGTDRAPFIVAASGSRGDTCIRAAADCRSGSYLEFAPWHIVRSAAYAPMNGTAADRAWLAGRGARQRPFDERDEDASLPVAHHLISNLKYFALGIFHGVTKERV